jgi:hypothetical protein
LKSLSILICNIQPLSLKKSFSKMMSKIELEKNSWSQFLIAKFCQVVAGISDIFLINYNFLALLWRSVEIHSSFLILNIY